MIYYNNYFLNIYNKFKFNDNNFISQKFYELENQNLPPKIFTIKSIKFVR